MAVRLDDKVAIITGASQGIGRAIALDFAERGVKTVGTARRAEPGEIVRKEVEALGGSFTFVQADVAKWDDCQRTVDLTLEEHGRIDILINNAGTSMPMKRVEELSEADYRAVAGSTLEGSFFMSRMVLPTMQAQSEGVILFIASGAGVVGLSRLASYCMSKAAVVQLSKVIAVENLASGIRSNALIVGGVATPLGEASLLDTGRSINGPDWVPSPPDPETFNSGLGRIMLDADQVANAVAMLCTDEAREITGGTIAVDRGLHAGLYSSMFLEMAAAGKVAT